MSIWTDRVTAAANVVLTAGVAAAFLTYLGEQHTARIQRTMDLLKPAFYAEDETQRRAMFQEFHDRYEIKISRPLSKGAAIYYFYISDKPTHLAHYRYNVARKHLNNLEPLAFAYVHEIVDRKIVAATMCGPMSRSFEYFETLIEEFRRQLGAGQSWQVIPQAVEHMNCHFPAECVTANGELRALYERFRCERYSFSESIVGAAPYLTM